MAAADIALATSQYEEALALLDDALVLARAEDDAARVDGDGELETSRLVVQAVMGKLAILEADAQSVDLATVLGEPDPASARVPTQ